MVTSSRIGMALLLALLVPAAFTATWAWLAYGGPIENAASNEEAERTRCLSSASLRLTQELAAATRKNLVRLQLDPNHKCVAPFNGRPKDVTADPVPGLAEATAKSELANQRHNEALPFLRYAQEHNQLTATGSLIFASLLQPENPTEAKNVLATAEQQFEGGWCGSLPFSLLLALHRARAGDSTAENVAAMLQAAQLLDAAAVPAILDEIAAAQPTLLHDERLRDLHAAADARIQLVDRTPKEFPESLPNGTVLVGDMSLSSDQPVLAPISICALPLTTVAAARVRTIAEVSPQHPELNLSLSPTDQPTWQLERVTMATSTLLTYVARTCLGLAIATLVLGNLLLWRLSRRELALVRMRRDFVDVVSHELRTPLTALSLKAEMLANGDVPAHRQPHYLQGLHGDVHRLSDQVERILDFGRFERCAALHRQVVPTRRVLAKGLRAGMPALRMVQQNVTIEVPRSLPPLDADAEVLARALRNLLENAAKYAPAGSTVALRAFADGNTVSVEIADTGPGVAHDERHAIFQPFVRASTATPGIPGSGLGLALVSAAAKAHGGTIDVRDRDGGGAVFTLQLPIAKENAS